MKTLKGTGKKKCRIVQVHFIFFFIILYNTVRMYMDAHIHIVPYLSMHPIKYFYFFCFGKYLCNFVINFISLQNEIYYNILFNTFMSVYLMYWWEKERNVDRMSSGWEYLNQYKINIISPLILFIIFNQYAKRNKI